MIPNPQALELRDWCDSLMLALSDSWSFGRLQGDDWRSFAVGLLRAPNMAQRVLPDPYNFTDWREWATRAYPLLEGAG